MSDLVLPSAESPRRIAPERLRRLLRPTSVAVVGASDTIPNAGITEMLGAGAEIYPINPHRDTVYGRKAFPSLAHLNRPVDAVLSLVNARASIAAIAEAARLGVGGVVVFAGGFSGTGGESLIAELKNAAGDMPVLGPNCNGFINLQSGAFLTAVPKLTLARGGIGMISHSGGYLLAAPNSAHARRLGFSYLITSGTEVVTDLVDYMEMLIDDEGTRTIALIVESLRRPDAFFAAAERARRAGKPVVALKLAKGRRARKIAQSHTGAITGEPWVYEAAFRQFGIISASDVSDLFDRLLIFEQLPRDRWTRLDGLAVAGASGGEAELASDVCEQEAVHLPELKSLQSAIADVMEAAGGPRPVDPVINPSDLEGFVAVKPHLMAAAAQAYFSSPEVDALLFLWLLQPDAAIWKERVAGLSEVAQTQKKPLVITSSDNGDIADWVHELPKRGIAVARGIRGAVRGLKAMGEFTRASSLADDMACWSESSEPSPPAELVSSDVGRILSFSATMTILERFGIPTAPFALVGATDAVPKDPGFPGPYVVKLADVPHRTEKAAVRLKVDQAGLAETVAALRIRASSLGVPGDIVIQPYLASSGEAFLGLQTESALGSLVVCGIGGTFVELQDSFAARVTPFNRVQAEAMIGELNASILSGFRGAEPWNVHHLAACALGLSRLAQSCGEWLLSLDINPLVLARGRFVAVDALGVVKNDATGELNEHR